MKTFLPLLAVFLISVELINGENFSPSPLDQQNQVAPIQQTKPFIRPQAQQSILPVTSSLDNSKAQNPTVLLAPVQPSSDLLPPGESRENEDYYEGFTNVKTKPDSSKLKRDNEVGAQQMSSRLLLPGTNWGYTGGFNGGNGGNGGGNNYEKPGSCYRGEYGNGNGNGGYNNNYNNYARNYRVKRQAYTPYYSGGNTGGFSGGNYYTGGNNNGYYPSRPNGISYCYRDYDCSGNQKCCSGYCRTPAFIG